MKYVSLLFFLILLPKLAGAVPGGMTLSGRILKPDQTPLISNNVSFQFSITDPAGSCVLYKETLSGVNMSSSDGNFEVALGAGAVTFPSAGVTLKDVFYNSGTLNCASGSTYTPAAGDVRKLAIQFYDANESPASWRAFGSAVTMNSVAQAFYADSAQKLGTNVASDFLLKAGLPVCAAGTYLSYDGTALSCSTVPGASGGTVTNIATGTGLTGGPITTTGTISLANSGVVAGNYGSATQVPALTVDATGRITSVSNTTITGVTPGGTAGGDLSGTYPNPSVAKLGGTALGVTGLTTGNFLKYNGTSWVNATPSVSDLSDGANLIKASQMPANCSANQTLSFSSPTGTWSCSAISISGAAFGLQAAGTFLAAPTGTTGAPTFRTLASSDLPNGIATAGTYRSVTVDTYGRVTGGTNPTTLAGYGITDAFANGGNTFGAAATLGTNDASALTIKTSNTARLTIDSGGAIGIGGAPQAGDSIYLTRTTASTAASWQIGMDLYLNANPAAASSTNFVGAYASQIVSPGTTVNFTGDQVGMRGNFDHQGSGSVNWGYGVRGVGYNSSTGSVTNLTGVAGMVTTMAAGNPTNSISNAFGVRAEVLGDNPNASIQTAYGGYFVAAPSAGNVNNAVGVYIGALYGNNKWGVYQDSTAANNYFAGWVGVGNLYPAYNLDVTGNIRATGMVYQSSDIRLKTNIDYLSSKESLENVTQLRGIRYDWKDKTKHSSDRQVGLIAQEVEQIYPEAVHRDSEGYLSVSYANLVAPAIEAIKELYQRLVKTDSRLEEQERKIASVEADNAKLKSDNEQMKAEGAAMKKALCELGKAEFCLSK